MKILILSHRFSPDIGGIESITEILATEFTQRGYSVAVATWSTKVEEDLFKFKVTRKPSLKQLIQLNSWADIVLENNPCLRLSWPSLLLNKPTVIALHTWIEQPDGTLTWMDKLKKIKLRLAKSVIAVSEKIMDGIFKNAIIIHNPFNSEIFSSLANVKRDKGFIFLGRLVSDKGADLAIGAIARLHKVNRKAYLTIVGDGAERDKLKQQVMDLNLNEYVNFKGSLTGRQLATEICRHSYMLIPSKWKEPFGIVALESIACGCIPIVSDGGGLPDAVGDAGLVFERSNLDDLVKKIEMLLDNPELENKIKNAGQPHIELHRPNFIAEKYLNEFRKVLRKSA